MRWASSNARQGRLHLSDFVVPAEALEPLVRATEQTPSVFQMAVRLAEVDAVDRHTSIETAARAPSSSPRRSEVWSARAISDRPDVPQPHPAKRATINPTASPRTSFDSSSSIEGQCLFLVKLDVPRTLKGDLRQPPGIISYPCCRGPCRPYPCYRGPCDPCRRGARRDPCRRGARRDPRRGPLAHRRLQRRLPRRR